VFLMMLLLFTVFFSLVFFVLDVPEDREVIDGFVAGLCALCGIFIFYGQMPGCFGCIVLAFIADTQIKKQHISSAKKAVLVGLYICYGWIMASFL
jgi:hypothetical protein